MSIFWRVTTLVSKFTGREPLISKYAAKSATTISKYNNLKIKEALNFEYESVAKSIEEVGKSYLNNH